MRPSKVLKAPKYLVENSGLFKGEGIHVSEKDMTGYSDNYVSLTENVTLTNEDHTDKKSLANWQSQSHRSYRTLYRTVDSLTIE